MTFRLATPQEQARMSWHQRQRYERNRKAYARLVEAERPQEPTTQQREALRTIIGMLALELNSVGRGQPPRTPKPTSKPELKPCGTLAAYRRHKRHGEEPCVDCASAERHYAQARRDARKMKGTTA